jgi:methylated-DNA-[protein]-cysteine S-methyltransferase
MKKNSFPERVRAVVRQIPRGKTATYGEVARMAGHPGAARAVGMVMKNNYDKSVPCHRVIRADGKLGGYNRGGIEQKRNILLQEGAL